MIGRTPHQPDAGLLASVRDKVVLVTGAAGSIGSEICRQVMAQQPRKLFMLDACEFSLFNLARELPHAVPVLGDVTHREDVIAALEDHKVDIVYHVAAYKHVTLCEQNPIPARRVNVQGTDTIVGLAKAFGVKKLVLVSTDKAVNPTCHMGRTKRRAEEITRRAGYSVVRFGNVWDSSGSVGPIFREQIARGERVTITDPNATRYFMSIVEAAQLVIQAGAFERAGTYILHMGQPINIMKLALSMGATRFEFIGLRPGEKLHEELCASTVSSTPHRGISREDE